MPADKDHITHEGPEILEKGLTPHKRLPKQRLLGITPQQNGMEQQGQQVEAEQKG